MSLPARILIAVAVSMAFAQVLIYYGCHLAIMSVATSNLSCLTFLLLPPSDLGE